LLRAEAVRVLRARPAAVAWLETRDRGVKKRWNFLGVTDAFRLSLLCAEVILGGDEVRLPARLAEALIPEVVGALGAFSFTGVFSILVLGGDQSLLILAVES
jgi:hypothetical protein